MNREQLLDRFQFDDQFPREVEVEDIIFAKGFGLVNDR